MATAKQKAASAALEVPVDEFETVSPDDLEIEKLKAEFGEQGLMIHIYRQGQHARDLELIDEVPLAMFKPMDLAYEPFNGGTFRLHARSETGIAFNRLLKVQRKTKPPEPTGAALDLSRVNEMVDAKLERLLVRLAPPAVPAPDPMVMFEKFANLMRAMQPAAPAQVAAPAQPTVLEQLATLTKIQELVKGMVPAPVSEEGITGTLLNKGIEMVGGMVAAAQAQQAANGGAQAALPAPPAPSQESEDDSDMKVSERVQREMLRFALTKACSVAKAGESAETFAEKYYEDIDDATMAELRDNPEWFAFVCGVHADCGLYEPWFTELRALFLAWWAEDAAVANTGVSSNLDSAAETGQASPHGDSDPAGSPGPGATS